MDWWLPYEQDPEGCSWRRRVRRLPCHLRSSSGFSDRPNSFLVLHQWYARQHQVNSTIVCWRHNCILWCNQPPNTPRWFEQAWAVGESVGHGVSSLKMWAYLFHKKKRPSENSYKLHNIEIPRTNCTKYLGVYVDSKLTWHEHIAKITSKANATLAFIRRNVLTTSEDIRSTAYKQLVRPVLEYASCAWDTLTQTVETKLQAVQRRAARFICGIRRSDRKPSTTGLLSKLDLQPLDDRRKCRRLQVFRTYHFNAPHIINEHVSRSTHHSSRRHAQQYFIPSTNTLHYRRFFFVRTTKDWNCLLPGCPLLTAPAPNPG